MTTDDERKPPSWKRPRRDDHFRDAAPNFEREWHNLPSHSLMGELEKAARSCPIVAAHLSAWKWKRRNTIVRGKFSADLMDLLESITFALIKHNARLLEIATRAAAAEPPPPIYITCECGKYKQMFQPKEETP
ncbi:MAG: hypothetical protein ACIALR_12900 [Blastopirellula sp. JB062]